MTYNLAQVDSLRRPIGSRKRTKAAAQPQKRTGLTLQDVPAEHRHCLYEALTWAVNQAAGEQVFVRDFTSDDHTRAALVAAARMAKGLEVGSGYEVGRRRFGRPAVWIRVKGA